MSLYFTVVCGLSGCTIFFHIPHKRHAFRGTGEGGRSFWMQNTFWFSFRRLSEAFPIPRRSLRDIIINIHRSSRKAFGIPVRFYLNLYSLDKLSKNTQISNLIKIHRCEPNCSMRIHRHDETNSRFSQCCERPTIWTFKKRDEETRTRFIWLWIRTGGGCLWMR
jgi:hypothetical protein